jgi:hypothetical protein
MQYLHETSLPNMVEQTTGSKPGDKKYESDKQILLGQYILKLLSYSTVYWWMSALHFEYGVRRKGFYVNVHEKLAALEYRKIH